MKKNKWLRYLILGNILFFTIVSYVKAELLKEINSSEESMFNQIHLIKNMLPINYENKVKITVIDTGISKNIPEIQMFLEKGINLLDNNKAQNTEDDLGHGTNTIGIIASILHFYGGEDISKAITILPIKALASTGDEEIIIRAIKYAVDSKSKIILLSLGEYNDTQKFRESIQNAEDHGVLIVAPSGNGGGDVKYPAAFDTVLSVGATNNKSTVLPYSNRGLGIDIVAPGEVNTTSINGTIKLVRGTSMAAPQVAAVAALICNKNPNIKPFEIRDLIRKTANSVNQKVWDPLTGYGMLRADKALNNVYSKNMFDSNKTESNASLISLNKMISSTLTSNENHWYYIEPQYNGNININLKMLNNENNLNITIYNSHNIEISSCSNCNKLIFAVKEEKYYVRINTQSSNTTIQYKLTPFFEIYKDPYEPNDKIESTYLLPSQTQVIKGTFHNSEDVDWYKIKANVLNQNISFTLTSNTTNIDPTITIMREGEYPKTYPSRKYAQKAVANIKAYFGDYYIKVSNGYINNPIGEYELQINFADQSINNDLFNIIPQQMNMITIHGKVTSQFHSAAMIGHSIYVPLREIVNKTEKTINWNSDQMVATVISQNFETKLKINENVVMLNNEPVQFSTPMLLLNGKTMVPLRFINEILDIKAFFNNTNNSVEININ